MSESNDRQATTESFPDEEINGDSAQIASVDPERMFRLVFDLQAVDLHVYKELLRQEEATSDDLAESIDRHRSYVNRALNSLRRCGLASRERKLLPDGGFIYVYEPRPKQEAREVLRSGIEKWADEASSRVEDVI